MKIATSASNHTRLTAKALRVAAGLALSLGLAATAYGQYMPTNTITFADIPTDNGDWIGNANRIPAIGVPAGIKLGWGDPGFNWGYGFMARADYFGQWWATGGPASSNPNGFDCVDGANLYFSSPVIIWSMAALRTEWTTHFGLVGYLNGQVVWKLNDNHLNNVWQQVTVGAGRPIDHLVFIGDSWSTRFTDITLCDATNAPPWPSQPITLYDTVGNSAYRNPSAPVQLIWVVDPAASSITLTNDLGEVFNAYGSTHWDTGKGSLSVSPTTATTYFLTVESGTNVDSQQLTVNAPILPSDVGFLTFEDLDLTQGFDSLYTWNTPDGVYLTWNGWAATGGAVGAPRTGNDVFAKQWLVGTTNSLGVANNATLQFTDYSGFIPVPVILNSVAVNLNTVANYTNSWGRFVLEGRLNGVVQWVWDECKEGHDWENLITKGAGIPIDELDVAGQFYQMDNFALALPSSNYAAPVAQSPSAQNGNFQFQWQSVTDWASYLVMVNWNPNDPAGWWSTGTTWNAQPTGSANTYNEWISGNTHPGFYRVVRVP